VITSGFFGVLGALAATIGVLALALRLVQRMQGGVPPTGRGVTLRVLQRVPLGPRQGLAVVQVADRVLVVSLAEGGTRLLTELEGSARDRLLEAGTERLTAPLTRPWRLPFLGRVALVVMLLAAPLAVRAQTSAPTIPPRAPAASPALTARPVVKRAAAIPAPAARGPASQATTMRGPASQAPPALFGGSAAPRVDVRIGEGRDALQLSGAVGLVVFIGVLTLLPALFLLMTSFTRILIVLHFLRSALGTQTVPPNQLLVALTVLLTGVVMNPVLQQANREALQPYFNGQMTQVQAYERGVKPFREFMLANTREQDLTLFTELGHASDARSVEELPIFVVVSAFVTSELRTSFQMGFVIFLPFVVVDIIVASVLMSLGMFMLPPMMISLPLKLLLFVLADGWTLVVQSLVASFR
jgi:flagellar biosynthetic protein FliP